MQSTDDKNGKDYGKTYPESRRPPKQKFSNFEEYLAAHGGMTLPLPPDPNEPKEPKEAPAPQPTAGESAE